MRLVQFGDIDLCACCGTHVARTGEIGLIKLFSTTHFRGGSRIEMAMPSTVPKFLKPTQWKIVR